MFDPGRLRSHWASTACYRDRFTVLVRGVVTGLSTHPSSPTNRPRDPYFQFKSDGKLPRRV
jgi:hypothetical protein